MATTRFFIKFAQSLTNLIFMMSFSTTRPLGGGSALRLFCLAAVAVGLLAALPLSAQHKTKAEMAMERVGWVDLQTVAPLVKVSLMYARADNFTGRVLYTDIRRAYLHPKAARALQKAAQALKAIRPDLSLVVYDAGRPMSTQQRMWDTVKGTPKHIYVSNPANGGGLHNYGMAVDITLCHTATGDTVPMGTMIDYMGPLAHPENEAAMLKKRRLTAEAVANRRLLRRVMAAGGFKVLRTEWWHFNLISRAEARRAYKVAP